MTADSSVSPTVLCHPPQQHQLSQRLGGKIPGRNSPVQMTQAWKQYNLYGKWPASTSDSGNVSAGFAGILSINNVSKSWTVFLRAAHHCCIFSTIKPAWCCSWTLLFQYTLREIELYIFKLSTLKSHSSRTWKLESFYLSIGNCGDLFSKGEEGNNVQSEQMHLEHNDFYIIFWLAKNIY